MAYREPSAPLGPQVPPEVLEYEQQLIRRSKRKKVIGGVVLGVLFAVGLGSCLGPIGVTVASDVWHARKTKLSADEQKRVHALLDPIEESGRKSQAAFEAIWPRIRGSEIGARRDLGTCRVEVPGPTLRTKDASRAVDESAGAYGWTFVDLTPPNRRSPLEQLEMPGGSIPSSNYPGAPRITLPPRPLKTSPPEKAPILASTETAKAAAELWEEAAKGIRADSHDNYLLRVRSFADRGLGIDVIVFLDLWDDPNLTNEVKPAAPPKDDYEAFAKPAPRPTLIFDSGLAIAHAIAWDPSKQEVACAAQALAFNSEHVTLRLTQRTPLQQDLVLELEHALERSFVAVGEAPPKLERPTSKPTDDEAAEPSAVDAGAAKPKPKPKKAR